MCGVAAIVDRDGGRAPADLHDRLDRARTALAHRGPDGHGTWISEDGRAALGHTRLSLVDLHTGAQPIASEDGRLRIIVNGEFYDYRRIRRELEARGHRFSTRSDSEIALHLYEDIGAGCLEHLRGEFAFVLWDDREKRLFAARDRFGIKPLFYAEVGDRLYVASEAKALFAAGVPAAWDRRAVFRTLFLALDQRSSLFDGVSQVPAGHYLVASDSGIRIERYWDADYPRLNGREAQRQPQEWVEEAARLLDESVRMRLDADVPVGCLLSGGLDSSATLAIASRHVTEPIAAFTVAFDHADYDESPKARAMAELAGACYRPLRVTESDAADHFADAVCAGEMVLYNAHGAARYLLSRAVRDAGYKTVLSGEGADELFAGYHFCRSAVLDNGSMSRLPLWLRVALARVRRKAPSERRIANVSPWLARVGGVLRLPKPLLDGLADKLTVLEPLVAGEFAADVAEDPYGELFRTLDASDQIARREPVKQILYLWMKTVFVGYVLSGERLDMAHSVELRLPFLDHRLFEFARRIPASVLAKEGRQKWVLREVARPLVTDEIYVGRKHGFLAPPSTLRRGNRLNELVEDTLRGRALSTLPFFDGTAVTGLLDRMASMEDHERAALDPLLLMMASLAVLGERWGL